MATQELGEAAKVIDWHSQLRPAIDKIRKSGKLLKRDGNKVNEKFEKVRKKRRSKHFNVWITKYNQELRTFMDSIDLFRKIYEHLCKSSGPNEGEDVNGKAQLQTDQSLLDKKDQIESRDTKELEQATGQQSRKEIETTEIGNSEPEKRQDPNESGDTNELEQVTEEQSRKEIETTEIGNSEPEQRQDAKESGDTKELEQATGEQSRKEIETTEIGNSEPEQRFDAESNEIAEVPFIDLSDEFRPDKLVEMLSNIYRDEWTNCFEECMETGNDECKTIQELLKILMDIFNVCLCLEWSTIQQAMTKTYLDYKDGAFHKMGENVCSDDMKQPSKELMKKMSPQLLPSILLVVKKLLPELSHDCYGSDTFQKYICRCTEFSWLAVVQDPPLALNADGGTLFNKDLFKEYTRRGAYVEFVVWPSVHVKDRMLLLEKGVVQCTDNSVQTKCET